MSIRKKNKIPFRPVIQILCDGSTEKNYSDSLKKERYHNAHICVDPKIPKSSGYAAIITTAEKILKDKSIDTPVLIFIILDMDTIHSKGNYQGYKQKKEGMQKRWGSFLYFIESRPCFEFWLLLHYQYSDKLYNCYDDLKSDLRKHLPGYCKKNDYTTCLYSKTKESIQTAIRNAKAILSKSRVPDEEFSYTTFYEMIEKMDSIQYQR